MNLILDVGNTQTKLAVFDKGEAEEVVRFGQLTRNRVEEILSSYPIRKAIISSVNQGEKSICEFLRGKIFLVEFSHHTPVPIKNLYQTPETLGMDRLASVIGSYALFPDCNSLVIDAGTCITYDFINEKNEYAGGAISPGLEMRFKALNTFTAKLPLVEPAKDFYELTGTNTFSSVLSGVQNGLAEEADGVINSYRQLYNGLKVLVCGGDTEFLVGRLKNTTFAAPDLVLTGLNTILDYQHD